ncbi:DUF6207 family protein [Streptomyces sp. NPDC055055]
MRPACSRRPPLAPGHARTGEAAIHGHQRKCPTGGFGPGVRSEVRGAALATKAATGAAPRQSVLAMRHLRPGTDEQHIVEPGLVVLDITGGDEDTVRAFMAALKERWATAGAGPVRRDGKAREGSLGKPFVIGDPGSPKGCPDAQACSSFTPCTGCARPVPWQ